MGFYSSDHTRLGRRCQTSFSYICEANHAFIKKLPEGFMLLALLCG